MQGTINKGFETHPDDKFKSITQSKYTNQSEQMRQMRPADVFEPGYDTVHFVPPGNENFYTSQHPKQGLSLSYQEAVNAAKQA